MSVVTSPTVISVERQQEIRQQFRADVETLNQLSLYARPEEQRRLTNKAAAIALVDLIHGASLESGDRAAALMIAANIRTRINLYPSGGTREGLNLTLDRVAGLLRP